MARLLLVVGPHRGLLLAALEAGRRLRRAGHDILLASSAERPPALPAGVTWLETSALGHATWPSGVTLRPQEAIRRLRSCGFEELLEDVSADLVLVDIELHEQMLLANARQPGCVAALNPFLSVWRRPGLPPPHRLTIPGRRVGGSAVAMRLQWWLWRLRKAVRAARLRWAAPGRATRRLLLSHLARELGSELRPDASQWLMPWFYPRVPTLCLHALEFEFPHLPAEEALYVGPMVAAPRSVDGGEEVSHPAVEHLKRLSCESGTVRIYATFGSFLTVRPELVSRLVRAVSRRSDWQLVLTLGGQRTALDGGTIALGELPNNVRCFDWVPQSEILRQVDLAITHGGSGSVAESVAAGVPQLVFCGHQTDMAGNAARIAFHGLGVIGSPQDPETRILGRLQGLLSDADLRRRVERFAAVVQTYGRERRLETTVDGLLTGRPVATALSAAQRYWQTVPTGGWRAER